MASSVEVTVSDGVFYAYLAEPASVPAPAVVVVQEAFGVNADLRMTCDELASKGFIAISPDLYWRQQPRVELSDKADWPQALALYEALDLDKAVADVQATVEQARAMTWCTGRVGVVGFCLGGLLAYLLAARAGVDAGVGYYGGKTDEFLDEAQAVRGPLLMHFGDQDEYIGPAAQKAIRDSLTPLGVEIRTYAGCWHAFARHHGTHFDAQAADRWIDALDGLLQSVPEFPSPVMELRVNVALVYALAYRRPDLNLLEPRIHRAEELLASDDIPVNEKVAVATPLLACYDISLRHADGRRLVDRIQPWLNAAETIEAGVETDYVRHLIRRYRVRAPSLEATNWPWPVRVHTLGRFEVLLDDVPLAFARKAPKKPMQLLKALIAFGGMDVPEQRLTDALWPDDTGDSAHNSFSVALTRLRKLLGDADTIGQAGGRVSLNRDLMWVDAGAFERAFGDAEAAEGASNEDSMRRAIDHYRGSFLSDDTGEPWTVSPRERLRSRFIAGLSGLARRYEQDAQIDAAISLYRRGIEADELAEDFYRGLMRCYRAREERAEALAVYRRLKQILSVILGIGPSPATEQLARELRVM